MTNTIEIPLNKLVPFIGNVRFEHVEFATHGAAGPLHYSRWLATPLT